MTSHEVTVTGFAEQSGSGSSIARIPGSTLGFIEVKPPIVVGENFGDVILGSKPYGVRVASVISTVDSTILRAEAGSFGSDQVSRQELINIIAKRVKLFADHPS